MKLKAHIFKLSLAVGVAAAALAFVAGPFASSASAAPAPMHGHAMGIHKSGKHATSSGGDLTYKGGPIETAPRIYISWWGPQWSSGFSTGGYSSAQAQTYITGFYSNVGGSSWNSTDTQYCQGVAVGTVNCGSSGTHVGNPTGVLINQWNDTSSLPSRISQSSIASAADRLVQHFGYSATATYFVFTPSGHSMSGFGTQWCGWHSVTSYNGSSVAYAYIPYQPDAGTSCGENFVNSTNNSYGNGYFDGFSVVGGHEYAEAATDPHPTSGAYGWTDSSGSENGDKCAWNSASGNITLGSHFYAVQPIWSNSISGCAM